MARQNRFEVADQYYWVFSKGRGGRDIFLDADDYQSFLDIWGQLSSWLKWETYGFCLLPDQYHFLVYVPGMTLSKGMRQLNGLYWQRFQEKTGHEGRLFQDRFRSVLIDRAQYLKSVHRCIAKLPLLRGFDVSRWKWGSFPFMAGQQWYPKWMAKRDLLMTFSKQRGEAVKAYRDFVLADDEIDLLRMIRGKTILGNDRFVKLMQKEKDRPKTEAKVPVRSINEFMALYPVQREAMVRAYLDGGFSQREIGQAFGVHDSTVSRAVSRF